MNKPEDNKAILLKGNAAIRAGDHEGFLALCDEQTEWIFVGEQTLHGKEAVRQWMKTAYKEPPKFEVETLIAEGEYVTALGKIIAKDDKGLDANYSYCDVWEFRNSRIVRLHAFVIKT